MNPEDIGSLVCGGFQGTFVTKQAHDLIVKYKISTMILSRKNAHSVPQMSKLIRDLQYIAFKEANYKYPLAFAIDEEGGMMNSLFDSENLSQFPGAMALAATSDVDLVYQVSRALALELRQIGFSIILGPVLDVVTKLSYQLVSVRSFGTTVDEVVKYGRACAKGLRDGGLITVGKHFPGIGNARVDSILELPMMADSLDQIRRFNSVPFAELCQDGLLDGVSAAGCGVPTIAPDETHACLSPVILTKLLREVIGFDGFVISECLEMDALYHSIGLGQGVVLAIYAGCDLVMVCHDFKLQVEAIESISTALANGMLDEQIINKSLARLEKVRQRLPTWEEIFPNGIKTEPQLFRELYPDLWKKHQILAEKAYRHSITLVRDYEGILPLSQSVVESSADNILVLTPLLKPIYTNADESSTSEHELYPGEEIFAKFGQFLASHSNESQERFNVLHTSYTANGLTALHEKLIENSKAVIVMTSEASRNMYQIGIVKYISMLCGASPSSLSGTNSRMHLAKPLIIVATLSPYDFFYNKSMGSAYLCCYDYTKQALKELAGVLMGKYTAQGCIPGEKKFISGKVKKRRSSSVASLSPERTQTKIRKSVPPKRRWLVDDLDLSRDWKGVIKLFRSNTHKSKSDSFLKSLVSLLHSNVSTQKHFVVRNSSLNILYGIVITWVEENGNPGNQNYEKVGKIVHILVDKSKRLQSIGKNLHVRALRYLSEERKCSTVYLGSSFPLIDLSGDIPAIHDAKVMSFFNNSGWAINQSSLSQKKHVMVLKKLFEWNVPTKIFRELTIVGVRFDICSQPAKLESLIERAINGRENSHAQSLYKTALSLMDSTSAHEVKIIIALEPTNQNVIGSIILFNNKSKLAQYYLFMESEGKKGKNSLTGAIVCPVVDPSYSNLTEIFKYGLICSAVTYMRSNFCESSEVHMDKCFMLDVADDKSLAGFKDIGFESDKSYYEFYDKLEDASGNA